jgi:hypothetical protein
MKVGRKPTAATRNLLLLKRKLFRKLTAVTIIVSSNKEFVFVKKKAVQKTDSSDKYFEENKLASSDNVFEKK